MPENEIIPIESTPREGLIHTFTLPTDDGGEFTFHIVATELDPCPRLQIEAKVLDHQGIHQTIASRINPCSLIATLEACHFTKSSFPNWEFMKR